MRGNHPQHGDLDRFTNAKRAIRSAHERYRRAPLAGVGARLRSGPVRLGDVRSATQVPHPWVDQVRRCHTFIYRIRGGRSGVASRTGLSGGSEALYSRGAQATKEERPPAEGVKLEQKRWNVKENRRRTG